MHKTAPSCYVALLIPEVPGVMSNLIQNQRSCSIFFKKNTILMTQGEANWDRISTLPPHYHPTPLIQSLTKILIVNTCSIPAHLCSLINLELDSGFFQHLKHFPDFFFFFG